MRILVHEWFSGGSLAGQDAPASLAREGAAMRDALVADLAALGQHDVVTTADPRFPLRRTPRSVEVVTLRPGETALLDELFESVGTAWLVAPETGGRLEALAARAEKSGAALLGPSARAIRRAADKARLPQRLARCGVPHPETRVVASLREARAAASALGFPVVVKPARGAGCEGVRLVRRSRELPSALAAARCVAGEGLVLVQRYIPGVAASVALVADGRRAVALAVNAQSVRVSGGFRYRGGRTPLAHPLAAQAAAAAERTCRALPGLKGYVGVDLVLSGTKAIVIEVNPRLTTAYLGIRAALETNVAGLALAACAGSLHAVPLARRLVRFSASGRIAAA
jgi:predicted ATP-grasp superfamily ATP-dependent carboligase